MSGHSKWSQIKRQKAVADKKRGNLFTKLANAITVAAKQGGADPATNFKLRLAVEKAKSFNMPNANIERAIKRSSGSTEGTSIEEVLYEAFAPGNVALLIQTTTDNKNRTASSIRKLLSKHQASLGGTNSVSWMFQQKGVIKLDSRPTPKDKESLELKIIDLGADDIQEKDNQLIIITPLKKLKNIKEELEKDKIPIKEAEISFLPKNKITLKNPKNLERLQKLLEELEELDDVDNYFTNADI